MFEATAHQNSLTVLTLNGVRNARTYRNVVTRDGAHLADNLLVRTARLGKATPADMRHLSDIGVTAVVDLRLTFETVAEPDNRLAGLDYVVAPMASDQLSANYPSLADLYRYFQTGSDGADQMVSGYRQIVADPGQQQSLARFVQTAITTPGGVAFHCSMGKDRTGVSAALILDATGVSRDFIREDYLYSNVENAAHMARIRAIFETMGADARMQDNLHALAATNVAYLNAAFDWIDHEYGDTRNYLSQGLKLGDVAVDQLLVKYRQ